MARKRKGPFKIKLFKVATDERPASVETRKKESEAQELAKTEYRRRRHGRIIITDGNGDTCWDSGYASSMPVDVPKW